MVARRLWVLLLVLVVVGCGVIRAPSRPPTSPVAGPTAIPVRRSGPARIVKTEEVGRPAGRPDIDSPAVGTEVKVRLLLPKGIRAGATARPGRCSTCCTAAATPTSAGPGRPTSQLAPTKNLRCRRDARRRARSASTSDWRTGPAWETVPPRRAAGAAGGGVPARTAPRSRGVCRWAAWARSATPPGTRDVPRRGLVQRHRAHPAHPGHRPGLPRPGVSPRARIRTRCGVTRTTDVDVWREHNPYDLADRLAGTRVYLACGNGEPGPLDAEEPASTASRRVWAGRTRPWPSG